MNIMLLASPFLPCLLALGAVQTALASSDGDADCDCFLINGTSPTYYAEHLFFDFRNLSDYAGVPDAITDRSDTASADPTSDYFSSDNWTSVWALQNWDNRKGDDELSDDATVLMINSPNNVYIQKSTDDDATDSDTFMTMRTQRLPGFQTAAEFESTSSDYQFVSIRMLARTIGSPGAVTAMFTYRDSDKLADVQEADLEILTRGPRDKIQYTNQPSYTDDDDGGNGEIAEATVNASLPRGLRWTDWAVHRLDWTPDSSVWYVDGDMVANISFQTPRDAAGLDFNVWSDGGSWSGNMSLHDEAFQQIQWIEMVYNTTDSDNRRRWERESGLVPRKSQGHKSKGGVQVCNVVCSIDERGETGKAGVLWESAATLVRVDGSRWLVLALTSALALLPWLL